MDLQNITELHYITPIATIPSILEHGILSHRLAAKLPHVDISMNEIQERRSRKKVFGAKPLHHYANLYFDAHNPMLSKLRAKNCEICILKISPKVLLLQNVVLTDRNASCDFLRYYKSPDGLKELNENLIKSTFWTHSDPHEHDEHKAIKCAEVLVPDKVESDYIIAAYVYNEISKQKLLKQGFKLEINIKSDLFF